ncbi:hypothetical protein NQT62_08405 [Limnobacter humi]|uniref:Putative Flp pilus-assembly TadG-like N-terminal domain-containing protein n=1 Tax=Limnobacter humi TaxID=1778671 RepID=A0ABT1WHD5_9BURK|nr:pilus assembly protein TadG-related protein [Limnobacter humi]MCQ8896451.1 hypothetical protein [Limnobacter humi]
MAPDRYCVDHRQAGIYTILTALVLTMSLGALGVLAVGYNVWEKNQLQGIADLTALTAARQMADGPAFPDANTVATENGAKPTDVLTIECIVNNAVTGNCENSITARVTLKRTTSSILPFFVGQTLQVVAEATASPTVVGAVGSNLLNLNTQQSALLNGLLTALGGGNINLSVAQWGALLGSDIAVNLLDLQAKLGLATLNDLLNLQLSAFSILNEGLSVGNGSAADKTQAQGILNLLSGPLNAVNMKVGDLLAVDLSGRTNTPLNVNLGELAQVALLRSVKGVNYTLPITSGVLNLDVGVRILESPQVFMGRKLPNKNPIAEARTAQVALDVRIRQPLNINIGLVSVSALDMRTQLRVAGGVAEVNDLQCRYPRAENSLRMTILPSALDLCVGSAASNLYTTTSALTCGAPAQILSVTLLGIVTTGVNLGASASLRPNNTEADFDGVPPFTRTVNLSGGQSLGNLLGNLNVNPQIVAPVVGPLLTATVNGLLVVLQPALKAALSPVLATVGGILDTLLQVLGIGVNQVTVNVNSMDCQSVILSR